MTPQHWKRVQELAANALEVEHSERVRYVESQGGGDKQLIQDVLNLVQDTSQPELSILRTGACAPGFIGKLQDPNPALAEGALLCDRFVVTKFLDAGGMGEVYAAWDRALRCTVALKTIRGPVVLEALERFRKEVVRARQISHRNVCRVYDLFEHGRGTSGIHFLTMELLHGPNLAKYIQQNGRLSSARAAAILTQLADGMSAAHTRGIIHRDLKPGNVMLVDEPSGTRVVVTDFGLALPLAEESEETSVSLRSGTPLYMAPELRNSGVVSPASDVYSFGVVARTILAESALKERIPGGRCSWKELIARCTETDPLKRPPTGVHLRELFANRKSASLKALIASAAVLLAVGAVSVSLYDPRGPDLSISESVRMTQYAGIATAGFINAGGRLAVYASDEAEAGNLDIWLRDMETGSSRRLTTNPAEELYPVISPDGEWVAYRSERNGGALYACSTRGGPERLVASRGREPAFSPDSKSLAFWTGEQGNLSVTGSSVHVMEFPSGIPQRFHSDFADARSPVWSPDGKRIVFLGVREGGANPDAAADWWIAALGDSSNVRPTGLQQELRSQKLSLHKGILWWRDYFLFAATQGDATNIWYTKRDANGGSAGRIERLTESTESQLVPSVAADGRMLYSTFRAQIATLQYDMANRTREPHTVTSSVGNDTFPSISANGRRLAFRRRIAGFRNVWLKDLQDGTESAVTTSPTEKLQPSISPDGNTIAWSEVEGGRHSVFLTQVSDGSTASLCRSCGDVQGWTPDGQRVIVATGLDGTIQSIELKTGRRDVLFQTSEYRIDSARFSPGGNWIAFVGRQDTSARIFAAPVSAAGLALSDALVSLTDDASWSDAPAWSSDGRQILFRSNRDGFYCIWSVNLPARAGEPIPDPNSIRHFHTYRSHLDSVPRSAFALSIWNQQLFLTSADIRGTVWLSGIRER